MIALHHNLTQHWLWHDPEKLKWWLDLLFMAAPTDDTIISGGSHDIHLHQGQMVASVPFLMKRWRKSRPTIITFLQRLEAEALITRATLPANIAIITVRETPLNEVVNNTTPLPPPLRGRLYPSNISVTHSESTPSRGKKNSALYPLSLPPFFTPSCHPQTPDTHTINADKFIAFWNAELQAHKSIIPQIRNIQGKRKSHILARCREYGRTALADMVRKAATSDFLNGRNPKGWVATFDWLILPTNFPKVIEGNFDNNITTENNNGSNNKDNTHIPQRGRAETNSASAADYEGDF